MGIYCAAKAVLILLNQWIDLTHYIRSGDFIQALLRDAKGIVCQALMVGVERKMLAPH